MCSNKTEEMLFVSYNKQTAITQISTYNENTMQSLESIASTKSSSFS